MSLLILGSIISGVALVGAGIVRRMQGGIARQQGGALIVTGLLLQSWWLILVALVLFKFLVLREDT
jgi:hypothetical protein